LPLVLPRVASATLPKRFVLAWDAGDSLALASRAAFALAMARASTSADSRIASASGCAMATSSDRVSAWFRARSRAAPKSYTSSSSV
jgi:hypothetical protein